MTLNGASEAVSIRESAEKQEEFFSFILQSFYACPESFEELKCTVFLASDNSSPTPDADRNFIDGAFALLCYLAKRCPEGC